ncbi:MAG: BolA/IbaG family iron-sulfur metabolism protein [Pseudomonadales bacterium]
MQKQQLIESVVREKLAPDYVELVNESHMHSVPPGSESHFKLVLVTEQFAGLRAVARHQKVYAALGEVMQQIHALALHTYTPAEWQAQGMAPASPQCRWQ